MQALKIWADELRKPATGNISLHLVLSKKTALAIKTYSTSLHRRILTSHVFLSCVKRSLRKSCLSKIITQARWSQSHTNNRFFQTCGSTTTDLFKLLFTQYKTTKLHVAYRYQQCHCLAALPAKMSVFNVTCRASIKLFQINSDYTPKDPYSYNKNQESLCHEQKHMSVLIWIETIINRILI